MAKFNFEEYRQPWETGPHWELKREFMEKYQDDFPEDRLLCLAQAYSNIELLNCSYPAPVMQQVRELSKSLNGCKRFRDTKKNFSPNEPEMVAQSGKRNYMQDTSKPFKFIKFCTAEKVPPSPVAAASTTSVAANSSFNSNPSPELPSSDYLDREDINDINTNLILYIPQGPDYEVIKKIAEALSKIQLKGKQCQEIERAINTAGVEQLVSYKFSDHMINRTTTCLCKIYVGNTLLALGRDNNQKNARMKAAEYAVEILRNLSNLPTRNLMGVINDLKAIGKDTAPADIHSQIAAMMDDSLCLIEKFAKGVNQFFGKESVRQVITNTAVKLNCLSEVVYINAGEELDTLLDSRIFHCDLVMKNILISHGTGTNKKKAKGDAAMIGILNLINFLENKEHPGTYNQCDSEKSLTNQELIQNTNILEFLMGEDALKRKSKKQKTRENILTRYKGIPEHIHALTKILEQRNIPISPSNCEVNTIDKATTKQSSIGINQTLLSNSFHQKFALFDTSDVKSIHQQTPGGLLNYSTSFCKKSMTYETDEIGSTPQGPMIYKCHILFDGNVIATGTAETIAEAKSIAQVSAWNKLKKEVYTIKVKDETDEGFIIQHNQVMNVEVNANAVSESNVGHKMMKMMGWSGGGIGKTGGIIEPIVASEHRFHQGLGFGDGKGEIKEFKRKIEALIRDYSQSSTTSDLIFSTDFNKEERKEIHRIATKYNLHSNSRGKGKERKLFLRQKLTVTELLNHLVKAGGSTHKYQLVDMSAELS